MMELLVIVCFCWLFLKVLGLGLRLAWGTAKVVVSVLFFLAVPLLVLCLLFAGGLALLIPLSPLLLALAIVKLAI